MRWLAAAVVLVSFLAGCGDSETWQDQYRAELRADNEQRDPAFVVQVCSWIDSLTDQELRQMWAQDADSADNLFNQVMADAGQEPSVDDYNEAIAIAIDEARRLCE